MELPKTLPSPQPQEPQGTTATTPYAKPLGPPALKRRHEMDAVSDDDDVQIVSAPSTPGPSPSKKARTARRKTKKEKDLNKGMPRFKKGEMVAAKREMIPVPPGLAQVFPASQGYHIATIPGHGMMCAPSALTVAFNTVRLASKVDGKTPKACDVIDVVNLLRSTITPKSFPAIRERMSILADVEHQGLIEKAATPQDLHSLLVGHNYTWTVADVTAAAAAEKVFVIVVNKDFRSREPASGGATPETQQRREEFMDSVLIFNDYVMDEVTRTILAMLLVTPNPVIKVVVLVLRDRGDLYEVTPEEVARMRAEWEAEAAAFDEQYKAETELRRATRRRKYLPEELRKKDRPLPPDVQVGDSGKMFMEAKGAEAHYELMMKGDRAVLQYAELPEPVKADLMHKARNLAKDFPARAAMQAIPSA